MLPSPQFNLRSDVVVSAGVSLVALAEPKTKQDLDIVHRVRQVLGANLRNVGVEISPPETFIGHVSVAYFCGGMGPVEYSKYKDVARTHDIAPRLLGGVTMTYMELRRFEDMEKWGVAPLASLTFGNELSARATS